MGPSWRLFLERLASFLPGSLYGTLPSFVGGKEHNKQF